jgi:hypothetical protein
MARISLGKWGMILKHKDDVAPLLAELERLFKIPSLSKRQRDEIEDEMWKIRVGAKGEKEAAYHIDFDWKDGRNSVVLHDLRIEHGGRVAQIDHLILNRALDCHVLESKGFGQEVRISDSGEWETRTRYGWKGMASPVEQNRRHIEVLESFIRDHQLGPKRLGMTLPIRFLNWVLVSPDCPLRRKGKEWDRVVKMDMFRKEFLKQNEAEGVLETLTALSKFVAVETITQLGQALIAAHQPATFNFAGKFGITASPPADDTRFAPPDPAEVKCDTCAAALEAKVISYCRLNAKKLGGKVLCQACQKPRATPACDGCGVELESKVIAFCRFNSKRFGGRKLCRSCQSAPVPA